ncbi:tyrosine-protein phosphatase [Pedobacter frigoris]|uniref:protein-tyrosine-phosphatase n=1 Tax=Pedobacter frigoris TaxID=2571272 RepID=A0A4U1CFQ8_9SPHI|nr:CpsB/CapC family capsule biosynthesis tyrosine phosphatase [Pedobacter frigoris]TKC05253.1 histidinol phosphatase [Pedobacter frigoris]
MFSIFNKSKPVTDLEWLGVDIHSHLLPGIDDGSPDVQTSVHLIKRLNELGFSKFICTPHIYTELYPNTTETILPALDLVKSALAEKGLDISVSTAAEHMIDNTFSVHESLLCMPDKHILVEMSYLFETPDIEKSIFDLQIKGYKVILAHPERYNFYHNHHAKYHRLKDMGVFFQLNLLAVTGYYGKEVKKTAEYLLSKGMYDFAATDLHHEKHLDALSNAVANGSLHQKLGNYPFKNKELFL